MCVYVCVSVCMCARAQATLCVWACALTTNVTASGYISNAGQRTKLCYGALCILAKISKSSSYPRSKIRPESPSSRPATRDRGRGDSVAAEYSDFAEILKSKLKNGE